MNNEPRNARRHWVWAALIVVAALAPKAAFAHHGGVSLAYGPGSPIETASPLTLPKKGFLLFARTEQVGWRKFAFADPENKSSFTFANAGVAYGVTPYLTASVFVPYGAKRQDTLGPNRGLGDVLTMFTLGFNHSGKQGFRLNRNEDTAVVMEESKKTFFAVNAGFTLPTGDHRIVREGESAPDPGMQPGFGSMSCVLGVSAARKITGPLSLTADVTSSLFMERDDFRFGTELRLDLAGVYTFFGRPSAFLGGADGILELNYLQLSRDQEFGQGLPETGGKILYLTPGLRLSLPKLHNASLGVAFKLPVWRSLYEQSGQQGAEGLEKYRAIVTMSFYF